MCSSKGLQLTPLRADINTHIVDLGDTKGLPLNDLMILVLRCSLQFAISRHA